MTSAQPQTGISAVLVPGADLESAVLDLAAVLGGLVGDRFEILLVCNQPPPEVADLLVRAPQLPLRLVEGSSIADECAAACYDLVFVAAPDGLFDVRELNRLLDAVERGADVAVGYRRHRADGLVRQLHKWGWRLGLDCALALVRRKVWLGVGQRVCSKKFVADAQRSGYRVAEIPVSGTRPNIASRRHWLRASENGVTR